MVEDNYKVTGKITISNDAAIDQTFSVSDELDDGTAASVDCPSLTVPAGGSVECSYTASTKDATENTATVKAAGNPDVVATAPVEYTAHVDGDDEVTLADPRFTYTELISDSKTKTFPETFTCPTDRASYDANNMLTKTFKNTATLKGEKTNLSKEATVTLKCRYPWVGETATGYGLRYKGTSNWFMVTKFTTTTAAGELDRRSALRRRGYHLYAQRNYDDQDHVARWLPFRERGKQPEDPELHNGATAVHVARTIPVQVQL